MQASETSKKIRTISGMVVGAKADKTITVLVERKTAHPLYRKYIRRSSKLHAHDEKNICAVGDKVLITETRPLSKTKFWRLVEITEKAE